MNMIIFLYYFTNFVTPRLFFFKILKATGAFMGALALVLLLTVYYSRSLYSMLGTMRSNQKSKSK